MKKKYNVPQLLVVTFLIIFIIMSIFEFVGQNYLIKVNPIVLRILTILCSAFAGVITSYFVITRNKSLVDSLYKEYKVKNKQVDEILIQQSLLDAALESTADGILVVDAQGKVSKSNTKFSSMWNIPKDIVYSREDEKLIQFILDQLKEPDSFLKKVNELYSNPEKESKDILEFKDGRVYERTSKPQRLGNDIVGRVWSFRDITKQVEAEIELKKERGLLRSIIDNIPDPIYTKDITFKKTLANKADLDNMGCLKEEDALGKTDFDFFDPESAKSFFEDDKKIIEHGQSVLNREESFIAKNGKRNWLLTSKIPLKDNTGNITGLLGIGRNITTRKKSEIIKEALYEISELTFNSTNMESLYSEIHGVVSKLMKAKNFYIALLNEEGTMISFPYQKDEFDPPYPPKKLGRGLTEYVLRKGEAVLIDADKDIELRNCGEVELVGTPTLIWLGAPLIIGGKTIGVVVVQDYEDDKTYGYDELDILVFVAGQIAHAIERKRTAEKLNKFTEELQEANQAKDKFFSIIAHDLKSPFQGLLGYSQILSNEFETLTEEEIKVFISSIDELSNSAFKLLQNLLDWSRLQTGKMAFNPEKLNLLVELHPTLTLVKQTALKKEISFSYSIDSNLFMTADKNMLTTVVRNLISNAVKFTKSGGEIKFNSRLVGENVEISVSDTGVGIRTDDLEKIFRIDKSISTKGTANEEGTGLGLLLCKEMIQQHNGKIWVESEYGKGTTFYFTIPTS